MSKSHLGIGEQLQHYDRIRDDAALAKQVDAEARADCKNEIARLRAINAKLLEACKILKGLIRYWQPTDVEAEIENAQIDSAYNLAEEAIAAAKEGQ